MSERVSGASERVSGASERANGQASGPVLQSVFLAVLDHSVARFEDYFASSLSLSQNIKNPGKI